MCFQVLQVMLEQVSHKYSKNWLRRTNTKSILMPEIQYQVYIKTM